MSTLQKIAVGSDHAAATEKDRLVQHLKTLGWEVADFTRIVDGRADYPVAGHQVARAVQNGDYPRGLLLCGTGLGMSYAANRHPGVRAALCLSTEMARMARDHNDSNVLVLPGRLKTAEPLEAILDAWLATRFSGDERHVKRIAMIEDLDLK